MTFYRFEIVVTLTGSSRSTGQLTEERTSYLPKEIMWGHRFTNIVTFDLVNEVFEVDYEHFDDTVSVSGLCEFHKRILNNIVFAHRLDCNKH